MNGLEVLGVIGLITVGSVLGGFCFGLGFWLSKRVATKLRIDLKRGEH